MKPFKPQPCPLGRSWDSMEQASRTGESIAGVRHCSGCERHVHDLSTMTELDARRFLARNGTKVCVTYSARGDEIRFAREKRLRLRVLQGAAIATGLVFAACQQPPVAPGPPPPPLDPPPDPSAEVMPSEQPAAEPTPSASAVVARPEPVPSASVGPEDVVQPPPGPPPRKDTPF